ncbi:hypothetical protein GCM10025867_49110 (plasmid) [Frondihabitans sucicola]|uniref:Uncharacterized protein n=1 Tax=Frondihabitans sucicola TaxID=1268041 RepID=A0ABN6Y9P3_9MICO|nr:hypothetical protein [Frondihabitans sucicola]BDZ52670.1 hypothetical protein GCM10025867_49110 [Frondihabitans sucicola]
MSAFDSISQGDSRRVDGQELADLGIADLVDYLEIVVEDDGQRRLDAGLIVDLGDIGPDDAFRNDESGRIESWVAATYSSDEPKVVAALDDSTGDWASQDIVFTLTESLGGLSVEDLASVVATTPKIIELHNDLNGGYRPEKLYGFHDSLMGHLDGRED